MGKDVRHGLARQLQEIPPAEHIVLPLVEARPIANRREHVRRHVLGPLLEGHPEEPPPCVRHALRRAPRDTVVDHLEEAVPLARIGDGHDGPQPGWALQLCEVDDGELQARLGGLGFRPVLEGQYVLGGQSFEATLVKMLHAVLELALCLCWSLIFDRAHRRTDEVMLYLEAVIHDDYSKKKSMFKRAPTSFETKISLRFVFQT